MYLPKPRFEERMKLLVGKEYDKWLEFAAKPPINSVRTNLNKITPDELKKRLENKGWKIKQPFKSNPEILIIENQLMPGEIGKALEHLLGYYYVQEISSMMPPIALKPEENELVLDLCAAPGSKTSQISMYMNNKGTILANDNKLERLTILVSNLEKTGCMNVITTKNDAVQLCYKLRNRMEFDKILLDAPCSGEGNTRSNPKTFLMWNEKMIKKLSNMQKKIAASVIPLLKKGGVLVYSTCTHAPEENEEVVSFLLDRFDLEIEEINLPIKTRQGITEWENKQYNKKVKLAARIYPQDNNTEGFFLAKMRKL